MKEIIFIGLLFLSKKSLFGMTSSQKNERDVNIWHRPSRVIWMQNICQVFLTAALYLAADSGRTLLQFVVYHSYGFQLLLMADKFQLFPKILTINSSDLLLLFQDVYPFWYLNRITERQATAFQ